jgi:hypothetical protein
MPDTPDINSEIAALKASQTAFRELMDERDKRYMLRSSSQDVAVASALAAADKALSKAENAMEKRFDAVNEFRQTLSDQTAQFARKTEIQPTLDGQSQRITELASSFTNHLAKGTGINQAWGYLVAAIGAAGVLVAIAEFLRK